MTKKYTRKRIPVIMDKLTTGQMFGQVITNNGSHFTILCSDNIKRIGKPSNMIRRGPRLLLESFVIISLRDFETNKTHCDMLYIASPPNDIIELFKRYTTKGKDKFNFQTIDDTFVEFLQPEKTNNDDVFDFDAL